MDTNNLDTENKKRPFSRSSASLRILGTELNENEWQLWLLTSFNKT